MPTLRSSLLSITATVLPNIKLTKQEHDTLVSRVKAKMVAHAIPSSVCEACGRSLYSPAPIRGWLSKEPLHLCYDDARWVNTPDLIDFAEELGYNE